MIMNNYNCNDSGNCNNTDGDISNIDDDRSNDKRHDRDNYGMITDKTINNDPCDVSRTKRTMNNIYHKFKNTGKNSN